MAAAAIDKQTATAREYQPSPLWERVANEESRVRGFQTASPIAPPLFNFRLSGSQTYFANGFAVHSK